MSDIDEFIKQRCEESPSFKLAWEEVKSEDDLSMSMIRARNIANLTQSQLASITGIDRKTISLIENGEGNPSVDTLKKIARATNTYLQILFIPRNQEIENEQ